MFFITWSLFSEHIRTDACANQYTNANSVTHRYTDASCDGDTYTYPIQQSRLHRLQTPILAGVRLHVPPMASLLSFPMAGIKGKQ